jgi:hypothetical protein
VCATRTDWPGVSSGVRAIGSTPLTLETNGASYTHDGQPRSFFLVLSAPQAQRFLFREQPGLKWHGEIGLHVRAAGVVAGAREIWAKGMLIGVYQLVFHQNDKGNTAALNNGSL